MRSPTDFHPHYKFLCVKGVVFATWWQGVGIAALQANGVIKKNGAWSADDVSAGLQDYLITVEMLLFAIAHAFAFGYEEYEQIAHGGRGGGGEGGGRGGEEGYDSDAQSVDYENQFITQASSLPTAASFREALWSSSVPSEMKEDFKQFTVGRGNKVRLGGGEKGGGEGGSEEGGSSDGASSVGGGRRTSRSNSKQVRSSLAAGGGSGSQGSGSVASSIMDSEKPATGGEIGGHSI